MLTVHVLGDHPALALAGDELQRCLTEMAGGEVQVVRACAVTGNPGIWVGTAESLGDAAQLPEVRDATWDDALCVRSVGDTLIIGGTNPRSALMGAYEYLRQLGAEWLWPGADGEVLPRLDGVPLTGFDLERRPPNRHRGVCIEGAPALEHVLDMVEWMPRVGYNAYFLQFQVAGYFWRLWYEHRLNPEWGDARELTEDECEKLDRQVIAEVKRRGLILHQVGHGWTAAALGLPTDGWVTYEGAIADADRELIALVNGERELWGGIPINTELCYSNPEARRRMVDAVMQWADRHREVDALHFWLSDAPNNHCECAGCSKHSPADWYAVLANELSPRLAEMAPDMKIVLLAYHDLLWPPETVVIDRGHGNLVSMFAPISRCYAHSLADPECDSGEQLVRPARNDMAMPRHNRQLVDLWRTWGWGDRDNSFCFDYHFMWPWMGDRLSIHLSTLMPRDIEDYAAMDLGGLMNCGAQRSFYPTGWPYWETARLLCGQTLGPADRARYFRLAYGDDSEAAMAFLDGIVEATGAPRHGADWWQQAVPGRADRLRQHLGASSAGLDECAAAATCERHVRAWRLLQHYRELLGHYAAMQEHREAGRVGEAVAEIEAAEEFLRRTEPETARALDGYTLLRHLAGLRARWAQEQGV
ncbi:MAG TPA: DUF4838 domain-containing protein [Armatimonadota bacterium]|nr:DUF4838 domain-containing protein [Armatimonadota bacterium]